VKQVWTVDGWQDGGANCYALPPFYHYFMFFLFASEVSEKVETEQGPDSAGSGSRRAVTNRRRLWWDWPARTTSHGPLPRSRLILYYTDASSCTKIHIRTGHTAHLVIEVPNYSHSHIHSGSVVHNQHSNSSVQVQQGTRTHSSLK